MIDLLTLDINTAEPEQLQAIDKAIALEVMEWTNSSDCKYLNSNGNTMLCAFTKELIIPPSHSCPVFGGENLWSPTTNHNHMAMVRDKFEEMGSGFDKSFDKVLSKLENKRSFFFVEALPILQTELKHQAFAVLLTVRMH